MSIEVIIFGGDDGGDDDAFGGCGSRCQHCDQKQDVLEQLLRRKDPVHTDDVIKAITDTPSSECNCKECQSMCQRVPCMGTPQDIQRLIDAGYLEHLEATRWRAGYQYGISPVPMVQIRKMGKGPFAERGGGQCPLWDERTGLCTVHAIKPTEGRLGDHSTREHFYGSANWATAVTWLLPANRALVCQLFRAIGIEPREAGVREHSALPGETRSA